MLNIVMDQYEFAQYDFGRPTNIKLYEEDKKTLFTGTGFTGVIQAFKRHGDGSFFPFRDVARGLAIFGIGAQIISNVDINFTIDNHTGTFSWNSNDLPTVPGYLWIKALLFKGPINARTEAVSSDFKRVFIHFGAPQ